MNIGLVIPSIKGGGAEKFVDRLGTELADYHNVYVINYYENYIDEEQKYKRLFLDNINRHSVLKQIYRVISLRRIKKEYKLDVCISFLENPNLINILSRVKKCRSFISVRNFKSKQLRGLKGKLYSLLIKLLYNYSDIVITNAHKSKEDLIKNFCVKGEKIKVIYNFYNFEEISRLANLSIEENLLPIFEKKVIISFGRMEKVKGFEELIYAYYESKLDKEKVNLVIIGDGSLSKELKLLILKLGIEERVFLIGWKDNPYKYVKRSNVFVLNSYFEGFPNSLVEAMCCGVPVVATNCLSGPSEIISDGKYSLPLNDDGRTKYGVLIPTPDVEGAQIALSNAMELLINNEGELERYAELSVEGTRKLDKTQIIQEWLEILRP